LTARLELRPIRPLDPLSIAGVRSRATANLRRHFAAALSTACDAGERPLTLSVAPRARPGLDQTPPGAPRTDSPASSSKGAASSAQSAFHRQVLPRVRFRGARLGGSPPPVSRLCRRGPGFRRAFAPPMLSPGVARPSLALLGSSPWRQGGPNAACRLLQPISIREHDRRTVRTPRTAPMVAHERSCFSNRSLAAAERIAGGCARGTANQDVTGQGPARGRLPSVHGTSRRDRSRWELHPNPIGSDTSCRGSVAPPAGGRRCQAITWMTS